MDSSFNLADIKSVVDGNEGFGMGGGLWLVILLLFLVGGNGFGFGGNKAATTEELSAGFNFSGVNDKLNELVAGQASINQNLGNAICQLGYQGLEHQTALSAQIADCCCKTQTAIHAEGEATRAMIRENEIQNLRDQVSALQLNAAMCGVVKYPTMTTYATQCNPFGGYACNGAY